MKEQCFIIDCFTPPKPPSYPSSSYFGYGLELVWWSWPVNRLTWSLGKLWTWAGFTRGEVAGTRWSPGTRYPTKILDQPMTCLDLYFLATTYSNSDSSCQFMMYVFWVSHCGIHPLSASFKSFLTSMAMNTSNSSIQPGSEYVNLLSPQAPRRDSSAFSRQRQHRTDTGCEDTGCVPWRRLFNFTAFSFCLYLRLMGRRRWLHCCRACAMPGTRPLPRRVPDHWR